jgi:hypothetical protein
MFKSPITYPLKYNNTDSLKLRVEKHYNQSNIGR